MGDAHAYASPSRKSQVCNVDPNKNTVFSSIRVLSFYNFLYKKLGPLPTASWVKYPKVHHEENQDVWKEIHD